MLYLEEEQLLIGGATECTSPPVLAVEAVYKNSDFGGFEELQNELS